MAVQGYVESFCIDGEKHTNAAFFAAGLEGVFEEDRDPFYIYTTKEEEWVWPAVKKDTSDFRIHISNGETYNRTSFHISSSTHPALNSDRNAWKCTTQDPGKENFCTTAWEDLAEDWVSCNLHFHTCI